MSSHINKELLNQLTQAIVDKTGAVSAVAQDAAAEVLRIIADDLSDYSDVYYETSSEDDDAAGEALSSVSADYRKFIE